MSVSPSMVWCSTSMKRDRGTFWQVKAACKLHVRQDLRHSYATWLVSDGVPLNYVAKVMGHKNISTTLDRYST